MASAPDEELPPGANPPGDLQLVGPQGPIQNGVPVATQSPPVDLPNVVQGVPVGEPIANHPPPPTPVVASPPPVAATGSPVVQPEPGFVPPGPQTTQTTDSHTQITGGVHVDPVIQAEKHLSQAAQLDAISEKTDLQAKAEKDKAEIEQRRAAEIADRRQQEQAAAKRNADVANHFAKQVADAQKSVDEIKAPPEESVGTRIGNAIALALGGLGAGLTHGINQAAAVIAANRDAKMTAWKAQYERAKGKVSGSENLYSLYRNRGLDDQAASALATKNMNDDYDAQVRAQMAQNASPIVIANGNAALEETRQKNLAADEQLKEAQQNHVTKIVDDRSVTKTGGDNKEQKDLLDSARTDEFLTKYRLAKNALGRFQDFVRADATGAAFTDFVAGKGGMDQGSFGPAVQAMMHKNGWWDQGVENIRAAMKGGVQPQIIKELGNALAIDATRTRAAASPAIGHFQRAFSQNGLDPRMVTGGETTDEAAAAAGATPSAYQGKK